MNDKLLARIIAKSPVKIQIVDDVERRAYTLNNYDRPKCLQAELCDLYKQIEEKLESLL